jgi:hypothetical protein
LLFKGKRLGRWQSIRQCDKKEKFLLGVSGLLISVLTKYCFVFSFRVNKSASSTYARMHGHDSGDPILIRNSARFVRLWSMQIESYATDSATFVVIRI